MTNLKAYTLGNNGFVSDEVSDIAGDGLSQASVLVFAHSRYEALRVLDERSQQRAVRHVPRLSDPEFRVAAGSMSAAFLGSWIHEPDLIVTPLLTRYPAPVARVFPNGSVGFWGVLREIHGRVVFSPELAPEVTA